MSSATERDPYASSRIIASGIGNSVANGGTSPSESAGMGLSPRQSDLNRYWSFYRCQNYDGRSVDWNGQPHTEHLEAQAISTQGAIPPGFYDAGASFPLKFRRPSAPYYFARIVVDRFTGLLFSERRHPDVTIEGDPADEDYLQAIIDVGRLWPAMIQARTYGGAMGSVAMGFQLVHGVPSFEVHDPRWCTPTFEDPFTQVLEKLEKRFAYPDYIRGDKGEWVQAWFWYRRVIDQEADEVWPRVPVYEGEEPNWSKWKSRRVEHNLGMCPAVWVQNTPVQDDIDGDPDCHGVWDMIESYDRLVSQAERGLLANCDPTLFLSTDAELAEGSDNAIKLPQGSSANYLEITAAGPKAALEHAEQVRERAFEVTACMPENTTGGGGAVTATEVVTRTSRMLERADILREQYGERGIKRLLDVAMHVCRAQTAAREELYETEDGRPARRMVRSTVRIPDKLVKAPGGTVRVARKMGTGQGTISLKWPRYFEPTLTDISNAATATAAAMNCGAISRTVAVDFLKNYFPIEDPDAVLKEIEKELTGGAPPPEEGEPT